MAVRKTAPEGNSTGTSERTTAVRKRVAVAVLLGLTTLLAGIVAGVQALPAIGRYAVRTELEGFGASYLGRDGVILQATLNDCGPAALANLMADLDMNAPALDSLGALAGTALRGTRASGLIRAGDALGLSLTLDWIAPDRVAEVPRPFIAWVNRNHFVTVTDRTAAGTMTVVDPGVGRYSISESDFRAIWSGEALLLAE